MKKLKPGTYFKNKDGSVTKEPKKEPKMICSKCGISLSKDRTNWYHHPNQISLPWESPFEKVYLHKCKNGEYGRALKDKE